ncbi:MAG: MATE family efflux transporter [Rhodobacteraceae bacterium]|nr:MATE family efflux transporter [Paracoccaceae bacterium]
MTDAAQQTGDTAGAAGAMTHGRVLRLAWPVVLANATVPILGAVDTGVVGQLGQAAPIGAVGIGAVILSAIYWVFSFLRMGTTGFTAQARGAGEQAEVVALLTRALLIAAAAGVLLIVLQGPIFAGAFAISPASAEVETLARDYMAIRIWSAPAAIALYGVTGWLIAQERTRAVLVIQVWMNGVNILLDLWFVLGLGWGVQGVAVATLIAEWSGLALGLWFCRAAFADARWRDWARVGDRVRLIRMAQVNGDILIRSVLLQTIYVSFLFFGSGFGDVPLAANQILIQFIQITAYAMDGFAFSAEALVGQAMGARVRALLRRAAVLCSFWGLVTTLVLAAVFALTGTSVIDLMTTAPEVRIEARSYLLWMVLVPPVGWAAWMLDGIFIGATRSRDMRNMMIVSTLVYFGACAALIPSFENHGLWMALLISYATRGITLGLYYPALERSVEAAPASG